jgi:F0F1-type ATP synthase delta subunit
LGFGIWDFLGGLVEILQLILLQVVAFVVIVVILNLLFGSQLRNALGRLQTLHQQSLEKEEVLNKEIEKARVQAKNEIDRSQEKARTIIDEAKKSAEQAAEEASRQAQAQAQKIVQDAVERSKRLEQEVMGSIEKRAIELSAELIQYTFTAKGQEALHQQFMDELIDELAKVDKERLAVRVETAEVITSAPLTAQERDRLKKILSSKLAYDIPLQETVDPSLIIGMMIKLGGLVADGSLKNKLARAMAGLRLNAKSANGKK